MYGLDVSAGWSGRCLREQGVPVPPDFPAGLASRDIHALRAASAKRLLDAASAADGVADFLARLDDPGS